ncbi:VapE domain-containing protein [Lacticaseibacillus baoqingensis]|uniref:VapE domain-containing protein n=1 Tax=Lacticaseibacillus baoqingensis TaxID=2486013 RepID=A0ABW4E4W7_9LACO|nr:VapE domain-containing protein [Lacticaseibacillus baoqingensis]
MLQVVPPVDKAGYGKQANALFADYNKDVQSEVWAQKLHYKKNSGDIEPNSPLNATLILTNDPTFADKLAYNDFTGDVMVTDNNMVTDNATLQADEGVADSTLTGQLQLLIDDAWAVNFSSDITTKAMLYSARLHRFNPVVDRMDGAEAAWRDAGSKPVLDRFFIETLGAADTPTTVLMTRLFFAGLIARAYDPGTKFDFMTILYSQKQGIGKTWLLSKIGGDYYTDALLDMKSKDAIQIVAQKLLVNDDELAVITDHKTNSFAVVKSFITRQADEVRLPYKPNLEKFPRRFVLAGTTNERSILKDATGSRRFNVITCGVGEIARPVKQLTPADIDMVLGEAVARFKDGDDRAKLVTAPEEQAMIDEAKAAFEAVDDTAERVKLILGAEYPTGWWKADRATQRTRVGLLLDGRPDEDNGATIKLDRISIPWLLDIGFNLDHTKDGTAQYGRLKAKLREIMDTMPGWEPRRHLKLGAFNTSGYIKI